MGNLRGRTKSFRKFMLIFLLLILFLGLGTTGYYYFTGFKMPFNSAKDKINPIAAKKDEPVNILLMGVDIGTPGSKAKNDPKRTDTIILLNYNPKINELNMVSIPRDTLIEVNGKRKKINESHAIGGVGYLIDATEKLLDVQINYYGKVDYAGFRKVIDTLGGIEMKINNNMNYDDASQDLHIHFKKGETVQLNGEKAEEFFRWRKNNDGTGLADGDLGRIENQHEFIAKVIDKLKSPAIIPKLPSMISTIPNYIETNMSVEEMARYGTTFGRLDKSNFKASTLKGDTDYIDGISYFIYDQSKNAELLSKIHAKTEAVNNNNIIERKNIKVKVLNGTSKQGLASKYAERIANKGYKNTTTGNGQKSSKSKVTIFGMQSGTENIIKSEFGIDNIEIKPTNVENFDIIVLLGEDYK
jgi:LCP family protein required for cell wall assembly